MESLRDFGALFGDVSLDPCGSVQGGLLACGPGVGEGFRSFIGGLGSGAVRALG